MITITKDQADNMLRIIETVFEMDQFSEVDFKDVEELERCVARAKLHQTLTNALYQQAIGKGSVAL